MFLMEELIEEIKKHPILYYVSLQDYKNVHKKERTWEAIAQKLNLESIEVKKTWKNLRDGYRQALSAKKAKTGQRVKPWHYEKQMEFLRPHLGGRQSCLNTYPKETINTDKSINGADDTINAHMSINTEESINADESIKADESFIADQNTCCITSVAEVEEENPVQVEDTSEIRTAHKRHNFQNSTAVDKVISYLKTKENETSSRDELDLFFSSLCLSTKKMPRIYQIRVKRELMNVVTKAEEELETINSPYCFTPGISVQSNFPPT